MKQERERLEIIMVRKSERDEDQNSLKGLSGANGYGAVFTINILRVSGEN